MFWWSGLETAPIEAMHSDRTRRISPEARRIWLQSPSRPISCANEPAERAIWPPAPGFSSTLWMIVPTGIAFSGAALPGFTSTRSAASTLSPTCSRCGARM